MKRTFTKRPVTASTQSPVEGDYREFFWKHVSGELRIYSASTGWEYCVCELKASRFDTKRASADILCIIRCDDEGYEFPLEENTCFMFGADSSTVEDVIDTIIEHWSVE